MYIHNPLFSLLFTHKEYSKSTMHVILNPINQHNTIPMLKEQMKRTKWILSRT